MSECGIGIRPHLGSKTSAFPRAVTGNGMDAAARFEPNPDRSVQILKPLIID